MKFQQSGKTPSSGLKPQCLCEKPQTCSLTLSPDTVDTMLKPCTIVYTNSYWVESTSAQTMNAAGEQLFIHVGKPCRSECYCVTAPNATLRLEESFHCILGRRPIQHFTTFAWHPGDSILSDWKIVPLPRSNLSSRAKPQESGEASALG